MKFHTYTLHLTVETGQDLMRIQNDIESLQGFDIPEMKGAAVTEEVKNAVDDLEEALYAAQSAVRDAKQAQILLQALIVSHPDEPAYKEEP